MMESPQVILASASPRRRELLDQIGISYQTLPVNIDESVKPNETPKALAMRLAKEKAEAAWRQSDKNLPVIGSDTLGELSGNLLVKPQNYEHARSMLLLMSGQWHEIYSAVAITVAGKTDVVLNHSRVKFREITEAEIKAYWQNGEPQDKAGAYAIQGLGAVFVERLEGSFSAVMGLPLMEVSQLLKQLGIQVLKESIK